MTPLFQLSPTTRLTFAGAADRYQKNLAALTLLRHIHHADRQATDLSDAERMTLAHYSAFGESALLTRAFERSTDLADLVTANEARRIKRTALTAFYTPQEILHPIWAALTPILDRLPGTLQVLEPALGAAGLWIATMPPALRARAAITAVELDLVSSQIAQLLYPEITLHGGIGFEAAVLPEASVDLVISNVPFGNDPVFYPAFRDAFLRRCIHDFFLARAIQLTRPGGLVVALTSYGTLDKRDMRTRAWLAQHAQLITAIRLPQGAFAASSGTQCGADLLIFQRHPSQNDVSATPDWVETVLHDYPIIDAPASHFTTGSRVSAGHDDECAEAGLRINRCFVDHPAQVLGQIGMLRHNGLLWQAVTPPDQPLAAALTARLAHIHVTLPPPPARFTPPAPITACLPSPRASAMLQIHALAKQLLHADTTGQDATALRVSVHAAYDTFVATYGPIHARANQQALKGRPELYFLRALETNVHEEDGVLRTDKTMLFYQPTIRPTPQVQPGSMTPDDALLRCLNDYGQVDLAYIATLTGLDEAQASATLIGRIYHDPQQGSWQTADAYLSGNVRSKLADAVQAATSDPAYAPNVAALEAVQPMPLTPGQIKAKLGAPWIPADVLRDFIGSLLPRFAGIPGAAWSQGTIVYHPPLARWDIKDNNHAAISAEATTAWGTRRMDAIAILECALNGRPPVVYDLIEDADGHEKRVPNAHETLLAQEKWRAIAERFSQWVWEDPQRADQLCTIYNTRFNSGRRRDFDGSHLLLPGINRSILRDGDLLPHQKDALWMTLQTPAALLDLCVGAGKTFIGLAWAHEVRRLGLAHKVLITVPHHLVEQWGIEANRLYPDMRVLVIAPDDFTKQRRAELLSRIATEQFDAILCAHTSFGFIEPGQVAQEFIARDVARLETYLEELRASSAGRDRRTLKEIARKVAALETRLLEMEDAIRHDSAQTITWSELGIDALFVDEAHEFKNLGIPTVMGSIPGVPKGDSKRAFDMRVKTWDLIRRGGRVVFATGTPILNSVGEAFIMQLYLAEAALEAHGIAMFDAWARTFAEVVPIFEMTPDGGGFRMNIRLARFVNLPELFSLWFQFTFSRSREQLGLPTPSLMGGRRIGVTVPASARLRSFVHDCVARVEAIKAGQVDPRDDNILCVVNDGRKAALDMRMVRGGEPDQVNKIGVLADYVAEIYHHYADARATQLIYCELGTPKR